MFYVVQTGVVSKIKHVLKGNRQSCYDVNYLEPYYSYSNRKVAEKQMQRFKEENDDWCSAYGERSRRTYHIEER